MRSLAIPLACAALLAAAEPRSAGLQYLRTYGSREGIHPPRVLNRKLAKGAMGNAEFPFGLGFPVAVTTDLEQRVWITDSGTNSVHVFDRQGGYREIRSLSGVLLQRPSGIASDPQGRVYLADELTGAIYVFDDHGEYDHRLTSRHERLLDAPTLLALSEDSKTIFVADPPRNRIVALNREGEVNTEIPLPPEFQPPAALAIVHNQIYVLGAQRHLVGVFSPAGKPRGELRWDGVAAPTAFTFDPARGLFLVANPRFMIVQTFDEDGRNWSAFGHNGDAVDQMREIDFLHVDRSGQVFVVDSRHGKVLVFGESLEK